VKIVNVHQAKTNLSQLLADVEHGEDIVIARNGTPIALLSHIKPIRREAGILCKHGDWADFVYDASLFAPLSPDEELVAEGWPV
jgi:prevent-host-death family protein